MRRGVRRSRWAIAPAACTRCSSSGGRCSSTSCSGRAASLPRSSRRDCGTWWPPAWPRRTGSRRSDSSPHLIAVLRPRDTPCLARDGGRSCAPLPKTRSLRGRRSATRRPGWRSSPASTCAATASSSATCSRAKCGSRPGGSWPGCTAAWKRAASCAAAASRKPSRASSSRCPRRSTRSARCGAAAQRARSGSRSARRTRSTWSAS